jgi:GT2 family glycosyltransferase
VVYWHMPQETIGVIIPAYNEVHTIERSLQAVTDQANPADLVMVVNNSSTDGTPDAVRASFPDVVVLDEPRKGTGIACNSGFNAAIAEGAGIIMRTDADTAPRPNWVQTTRDYLATNTNKVIVGGPSRSLRDAHYRRGDEVIVPLMFAAMRYGGAVVRRQVQLALQTAGHNMAIRSEAFEAAGGFPDAGIDTTDEDCVLLYEIYRQYGLAAIGRNPDMVVETSARRIRKLGFIGMLRYYAREGADAGPHRRRMLDGQIDIR